MPRFFFHLADGVLIEDNHGSRCNTREDARVFAQNLAAEYGRNRKLEKIDDLSIIVTDETGTEVYRAPVINLAAKVTADTIGETLRS